MSDIRLKLSDIDKSFGPVSVLKGVEFSVKRGEVVGLLGENGAGKSTLMNIVSGSLTADAGDLSLDGEPLSLDNVRDGIAKGIRFVHQELSTVGSLTVAENIFLGDYRSNAMGFIDRKKMADGSRDALTSVGLGELDPGTSVSTLSPGQQQLIEIAKAIVVTPSLLILDEPTSSLTPVEAAKLFKLVHGLAEQGVAVIFITHKLEEALEHCDRIVVLRDGQIVSDEIAAETDKPRLIQHMVGKSAVFEWKGTASKGGLPMVQIRGLRDEELLSPIDLDIAAGEVVALFGLIGSGRTEFMETVFGFRKAAAGSVSIDGDQLRMGHVPTAVRNGIVMVPEGRKVRGILPSHSVSWNVALSSHRKLSRLGFMQRAHEQRHVDNYAGSLNIRMTGPDQQITALSGGNQQKAVFGRALLADPRLLLLDEPTHGVDVGAKSEIYEIIHDLAHEGMSVIVSSSELPEVFAIADRCVVFSKGELVGDLDRSSMTEQEILHLAFARH